MYTIARCSRAFASSPVSLIASFTSLTAGCLQGRGGGGGGVPYHSNSIYTLVLVLHMYNMCYLDVRLKWFQAYTFCVFALYTVPCTVEAHRKTTAMPWAAPVASRKRCKPRTTRGFLHVRTEFDGLNGSYEPRNNGSLTQISLQFERSAYVM